MPRNNDPLNLTDAESQLLDGSSFTDRQVRLEDLLHQLEHTGEELKCAQLKLEIAGLQLDLDDKDSAWQLAHEIIPVFINHKLFEDAALAGQYVYLCDKDDAISAIGQAAWLAVTYPIDPHLTVNILDHIVDETPDKSDGAAVVAATAHYVVDLRADSGNREQLELMSGSMLARVARRHSNIEDQTQFETWVNALELNAPEQFLVRLRNVIDVMVQDTWWFDRDVLTREFTEDPQNNDNNNQSNKEDQP